MARQVLRKGRMLPEDEEKIQRCTAFFEQEVGARDLTSSLYSAKILDLNDRSKIDSGETRVGRVRRLLEMLIMRGPCAYHEFIRTLEKEGYDHVVGELQTNGDGAEAGNNIPNTESTDRSLSENRLGRIEVLLDQLCQRVNRLEIREKVPDFPDKEFADLKKQLSGLKANTMSQIRDLMKENIEKGEKIAEVTFKLEEKQKMLQEAEERIMELENRIHELERHCNEYSNNIDQLKKHGGIQADKLQRQERKMEVQSDRLHKQEKKLGQQEKKLMMQDEKIRGIQQENEEKIGEMSRKMSQMTSVLETVQSNMAHDWRTRVIGRNVPQQTTNRSKNKWK